jgi:hypothetical protein
MPRYLTLAEAAARTRGRDGQPLSPVTLRVALQRGRLSGRKEGKTWLVTEDALRTYLAARPKWWKPTPASRR